MTRLDCSTDHWDTHVQQHCKHMMAPAANINTVGMLTHWGRVTHICVGKLTIIGSDNGSSPTRRQAIIWTNAGILLIGPLGTNFSEILIGIETFSFTKMHLKMSSAKWRPFCLGLNVLRLWWPKTYGIMYGLPWIMIFWSRVRQITSRVTTKSCSFLTHYFMFWKHEPNENNDLLLI